MKSVTRKGTDAGRAEYTYLLALWRYSSVKGYSAVSNRLGYGVPKFLTAMDGLSATVFQTAIKGYPRHHQSLDLAGPPFVFGSPPAMCDSDDGVTLKHSTPDA